MIACDIIALRGIDRNVVQFHSVRIGGREPLVE